jgi:hypothetical protein
MILDDLRIFFGHPLHFVEEGLSSQASPQSVCPQERITIPDGGSQATTDQRHAFPPKLSIRALRSAIIY